MLPVPGEIAAILNGAPDWTNKGSMNLSLRKLAQWMPGISVANSLTYECIGSRAIQSTFFWSSIHFGSIWSPVRLAMLIKLLFDERSTLETIVTKLTNTYIVLPDLTGEFLKL